MKWRIECNQDVGVVLKNVAKAMPLLATCSGNHWLWHCGLVSRLCDYLVFTLPHVLYGFHTGTTFQDISPFLSLKSPCIVTDRQYIQKLIGKT